MKKYKLKKSIPGIRKGAIFRGGNFGYICPYDQPHHFDYVEFRADGNRVLCQARKRQGMVRRNQIILLSPSSVAEEWTELGPERVAVH